MLHQFEDARDLSRELLADYPHHAYTHGTLVDALVELGEYDEAVEVSDRLQALKPGLPSYSRASYIRELHGDTDGRHRRRCASRPTPRRPAAPERAWALYHLGNLYLGDAKPDTAAYIYRGHPRGAARASRRPSPGSVTSRSSRATPPGPSASFEEARSLQPLEMIDELLVEAYAAAGDEPEG